MLTVKDLVEKYQISQATVYNWMAKGMPFHKIGGKLTRFDAKEVDNWVKGVSNGETTN
jgi:excisionase family DNA binding protein